MNEGLRIYELVSLNSNLCPDVRGAVTTTVHLQQYSCDGASNQQFRCLDIAGASQSNGAALQQHPCTGGGNQLFNFR